MRISEFKFKLDKTGCILGIILIIALTGYYAKWWLIARVDSNSTQNGYYFILLSQNIKFKHGDTAVLCIPTQELAEYAIKKGLPTHSMYCSYATPLVKLIAGLPGDSVIINKNGVNINGKTWQNSLPLGFIPAANFTGKIESGVVIMGTHPRSFDSRYLGIVPTQDIIGKAYLIWRL